MQGQQHQWQQIISEGEESEICTTRHTGTTSSMEFWQFMASRAHHQGRETESIEWPKTRIKSRVVEGSSRRNHLAN